jgi:hypothetical protein
MTTKEQQKWMDAVIAVALEKYNAKLGDQSFEDWKLMWEDELSPEEAFLEDCREGYSG